MMGKLFTFRFNVIILIIFILSTALSYALLSRTQEPNPVLDADTAIDTALEYSINGAYNKSFPILKQLADQDVIRAKLYLAVAYYHGQGVSRDRQQAKALFLELHDLDYEAGIVSTYLNLIGSLETP